MITMNQKNPQKPLIQVGEAASVRQKWTKKRSLRIVNEHFEAIFNAVMATQVMNQWFLKKVAK